MIRGLIHQQEVGLLEERGGDSQSLFFTPAHLRSGGVERVLVLWEQLWVCMCE